MQDNGRGGNTYLKENEHDEIFLALADSSRRAVLQYLIEAHPSPVPVPAAVTHLSRRADVGTRRAEVKLKHVHLPKLDAYGLVEYDADTGEVRFGGDELTIEILELLE